MIEQFKSARKVGTPLICVRTPDPRLTIDIISRECGTNKEGKENPIFVWDCINGIKGRNGSAQSFVDQKLASDDTTNAVAALEAAQKLPVYSILFLCNAHRGITPDVNPNWVQGVWNLRETNKANLRTLVMIVPDVRFPAELAQDVLVLDEPLPTPEQLRTTVLEVLNTVGEKSPDEAMVEKAVDATCGLAKFPAEQACFMSLRRNQETQRVSLNLDDLWARKVQMIEQTPGLSVWRGGQRFEDIGGYENVKTFLLRLVNGKRKPRGIVFMDEIEKLFAGATSGTGDTSGVTQGFLGTLLSYMQDNESSGAIFIGPAGSGKSEIAKATGNTAEVPTIAFDLSGMKDSLVGQSLHGDEEIYVCGKCGQDVERMTIREAHERWEKGEGAKWHTWSHSDYCGYHIAKVEDVIRHQRKEEFLRITTKSGRTVVVTDGHSLFVRKRDSYPLGVGRNQQSPILLPVECRSLKIGDQIAIAKNLRNDNQNVSTEEIKTNFFRVPINEDLMTLIGLWLGDGSANGNSVRISSNTYEPEIEQFLERFGGLIKTRKEGRAVDITIKNVELFHCMRALGLCSQSHYSHTKRVPAWVFGCNEKQICCLLRGYFSADGCFSGHNLEASTVSRRLAQDIALLLLKVNIFPRIRTKDQSRNSFAAKVIQGHMKVYNISMAKGSEVLKFKKKISFMQAKRRAKFDEVDLKNYGYAPGRAQRSIFWDPIVQIEKVPSDDLYCYDLSVATHEKFVAGGIVVHNSEARLRQALKVVTAVTQGRAFFIATCNRIAALPPELRRRFKSGTFFFDLPGKEERELIWKIYADKYQIPANDPRPDDTDWTGAEIRQCCYLASEELSCTLQDAAQYIVPVAKSAERQIAELRAEAHGRFISASHQGFYKNKTIETATAATRMIDEIQAA